MQGKQLRFPAGNAQLALLKTTAATTAETISIDLPAHLVWNEERTQRISAPLAGRVDSIRVDLGQGVAPGSALLKCCFQTLPPTKTTKPGLCVGAQPLPPKAFKASAASRTSAGPR